MFPVANYFYMTFPACLTFSIIWLFICPMLIIYLSDVSNIVNYPNIQMFDISCMSDVLKHLINYLSNVFGVSNIVNYSITQLSDISCMSDVLI